jgi:hypothetical protein
MHHIEHEKDRAVKELQDLVNAMTRKQEELQQANNALMEMSIKRVQLESYINGLEYALTPVPPMDTPTAQEDRYTQPAMYRGERVMIIPGEVLLSKPGKYNIKRADGSTGYAVTHEVELIEDNPPANEAV